MSNEKKKSQELEQITAFLAALGISDDHLFKIDEDQGDFGLNIAGKRISVEMVQIMYEDNDYRRIQFEKECNYTCERAENYFKKYEVKQELEVRVDFRDTAGLIDHSIEKMINRKTRDAVAQTLAKLVKIYMPAVGGEVLIDRFDIEFEYLLPVEVDSISIVDVTGKWEGFFSSNHGYTVPQIDVPLLQNLISVKNNKDRHIKYKSEFDEFWLLMTTNHFSFAGHYNWDYISEVEKALFICNFNRVFLFDLGVSKWTELKNLTVNNL